jgi:hypothetical protein
MTNDWKQILDTRVVEQMAENAHFKNGIPVKAAVTRAGINAGLSNTEIQVEVAKLYPEGTPINCIRWYRSNPGPRFTSARTMFSEAYMMFKESGGVISNEDLIKIAEANLAIIFNARGADLTVLSKYGIVDSYQSEIAKKKQEMIAERMRKTREAKAKKNKTVEKRTVEEQSEIDTFKPLGKEPQAVVGTEPSKVTNKPKLKKKVNA